MHLPLSKRRPEGHAAETPDTPATPISLDRDHELQERETDRLTDRQKRDRKRDKKGDRQTHTQAQKERQTDRHTGTAESIETDKRRDKKTQEI